MRFAPGELSFEARIGGGAQRVWLRTSSPIAPNADAVLAACLMPAMRFGGTLAVPEPVSPRVLRNQREFQSIQRAWSRGWTFGDPPLEEVEVVAPVRPAEHRPAAPGRVAAFFSGGVDSWSTVLDHPELTDLIFVRGLDLFPGAPHQDGLADQAETRLREAAGTLGLQLHVVETNLREFSDPLAPWDTYFGCALTTIALFLAPVFERVLIAGDADHEVQSPFGANRMVDQLWSTEQLEIVDDGGRYSRVERLKRIVGHPAVQRTLRVCWENPDGAYNCGRCRKCLMTTITLEALGARAAIDTFPPELDLEAIEAIEIGQPVLLTLWEDVLDAVRDAGRSDLEPAVEAVVARAKRGLGLSPGYRRRNFVGPPPTVRIAVIVPVWRQAQYMAAAVESALTQEIATGVGVVIVNDGCPDPRTDRIGQLLRDAHPDRVAYLRQPNRGLPAARNAGIRRAFARWPHLEAIFPLDADNMLSRHTLAALRALLEVRPDAAWASPTLEFFGGEHGEWSTPEPFLTYRQLFGNQSDAGSLIRRSVFEAGIEFDESMTEGFEDWEFFLHAALAGFRGAQAGRCGFRYRRRPDSMLTQAMPQSAAIETSMRRRHHTAYEPGALARREHAEAPRFALVRCDRDDALLTAACDLPPHRLKLIELLRPRSASGTAPPLEAHLPAVTVLTTATVLEWLEEKGLLAETLLRLQGELRTVPVVGLRIERDPNVGLLPRGRRDASIEPAGLALRTRTLAEYALAGEPLPEPEEILDVPAGRGRLPGPLPGWALKSAMAGLAAGARPGKPVIADGSQAQFMEYRHVDLQETTLPWSGAEEGSDAGVKVAA